MGADLRRRVLEQASFRPSISMSNMGTPDTGYPSPGKGSTPLRFLRQPSVPSQSSRSSPRPSGSFRAASFAQPGSSGANPPSGPQSVMSGDVQAVSDLLMLLLGHEIDRMVAWHNPNGVVSKVLLHQSEFSFELTLASRMDEAAWLRHLDVAWRTAPSVAVKMVRACFVVNGGGGAGARGTARG